jgi:hypothetical protein
MEEVRERYADRDSEGAPAGHLRGYLIAAEYARRALTMVKAARVLRPLKAMTVGSGRVWLHRGPLSKGLPVKAP